MNFLSRKFIPIMGFAAVMGTFITIAHADSIPPKCLTSVIKKVTYHSYPDARRYMIIDVDPKKEKEKDRALFIDRPESFPALLLAYMAGLPITIYTNSCPDSESSGVFAVFSVLQPK